MKKHTGSDPAVTRKWRPATQAVRAGTWRSEMGETSEALFLNSGFTYDDAETPAARFAGEVPGNVYSRYTNPTVRAFEERIAALELPNPKLIGFGISDAATFRTACAYFNGAIIGSAFIRALAGQEERVGEATREFVGRILDPVTA